MINTSYKKLICILFLSLIVVSCSKKQDLNDNKPTFKNKSNEKKVTTEELTSDNSISMKYYYEGEKLFYNEQNLDEALLKYNKAIEEDPNNHMAKLKQGIIKHSLGDSKDGEVDIDSVLEEYPYSATANFYKGKILSETLRNEESLRYFNKTIELNPEVSIAYVYRGNIYAAQEKWKDGIEDFTRALELGFEPNDEQNSKLLSYIGRGFCYMNIGKLNKAESDYTEAIIFWPDNPFPYFYRGSLYHETGREKKAMDDFTVFLNLIDQKNGQAALKKLFYQDWEQMIAPYKEDAQRRLKELGSKGRK
ncbi:MAG: tetratricopeptide repeat protein [bacterium]